ncbi:MAG: hypothetical protein ACO1RA_08805 [Planctomycetaceae bacterium]
MNFSFLAEVPNQDYLSGPINRIAFAVLAVLALVTFILIVVAIKLSKRNRRKTPPGDQPPH